MTQKLSPIDYEFSAALKALKRQNNLTIKDLAKIANVSDRFVQMVLSEERGAGKENLEAWSSYFGLSYDEMIKFGRRILAENNPTIQTITPATTIQSSYLEAARLVSIPLLNSEVSAGHHLAGAEGVKTMVQMPEDILGRKTSDGLGMITVAGDSMEPMLKAGDKVIFDANLRALDSGGVFVIAMGERLAVKRIQAMHDGKVMIKSDNPAYSVEIAPPEQVHIKGRVIWYGRALG